MNVPSLARTALKRIPLAQSLVKAVRQARGRSGRVANVAMFHTGRCGSTVVGNLLNQHSRVRWASEIFEQMHRKYGPGRSARSILVENMYETPAPVYGFETKYLAGQHLRPEWIGLSLEDYVALLKELGFSKFILLRRENYLRRAISAEVGRQEKAWHARQDKRKATTVRLDVDSFLTGNERRPLVDLFHHMDEAHERLTALLAGSDLLHLCYEDDILADPRAAYAKVCPFIGVEAEPVDVQLKRTNPFALHEMLENPDDVRRALAGTPYAWMLDA